MAKDSKRNPSETSDSWGPCDSDELVALGTQLRAKDNRQRQMKTITSAAAVSFVAVLALGSLLWLDSGNPGGITCGECFASFNDYHGHLTDNSSSMSGEAAQSMSEHLAVCALCRQKFEARFPGVLTAALQDTGGLLARNDVQTAIGLLRLAMLTPPA